MELYFLNEDFTNASMPVDDFESFTWETRSDEAGAFSLHLRSTRIQDALKATYIFNSDAASLGIIEDITVNSQKGAGLEVRGSTIEGLLRRRVIDSGGQFEAETVEAALYAAFSQYGFDGERLLPGLEKGELKGYPDTGTITVEPGATLHDALYKAAQTYRMRPEFYFDYLENRLYFGIYKGVDHTVSQDENGWVIFSQSFENIKDSRYERSAGNYCNFAYVTMENDAYYGRVVITLDEVQEGEPRLETYIPTSVSSEAYTNANGVLVPKYILGVCKRMMLDEAREVMAEKKKVENVSGAFVETKSFEYRKDFFVGDLVSFDSPELGIQVDAQVAGCKEIYENGRKSVEIQIGKDLSPVRKLKKIVKKG